MTIRDDKMTPEAEIAVLSKSMETLTKEFAELRRTLEARDKEIHSHINRQIGDGIMVSNLTLKNEMTKYADDKILASESSSNTKIKTWVSGAVAVSILSVTVTVYINSAQSATTDMAELFKVMMQENRKNIKQTQIIIEPEHVIP